MNKHTPAPWTLKPQAKNHQYLTGDATGLIADIHKDEDARLISAAPELLEALEILLPIAARVIQGTTDGKPILQQARAAIDKATGVGQ